MQISNLSERKPFAEEDHFPGVAKKIWDLSNELLEKIFCEVIQSSPSWKQMGALALVNRTLLKSVLKFPDLVPLLFKQASTAKLSISKSLAIRILNEHRQRAHLEIALEGRGDLGQTEVVQAISLNYAKFKAKESKKTFLIVDQHIEELARCQNLQEIELDSCSKLTGKSISALFGCPKLQALTLRDLAKVPTLTFDCNSNIRILHLHNYLKLVPASAFYLNIAAHCPQLHTISLENLTLKDKALEVMAMSLPIVSLCLNNTKELTDHSLKCLLAHGAKKLHSLTLYDAGKFTDRALRDLKECESMQNFRCSNISLSDELLKSLSESWPKLKTLEIRSARELTSHGLESIMKACQELTTLIFDDLFLTFDHLKAILESGINLQELSFEYFCRTSISEDQIVSLFIQHRGALRHFRKLHSDSTVFRLSSAQFDRLKTAFPELEISLLECGN